MLELIRREDRIVTLTQLTAIPGMGPARSSTIAALLELARRLYGNHRKGIHAPEDILPLVADIEEKSQEHFLVLTLDGANQLIRRRTVFKGTLNQSLVHPREVFRNAIVNKANAVILCHNHPSGNLNPSDADIRITQKIKEASGIMDIQLLDHLILTSDDSYHSFADNGQV